MSAHDLYMIVVGEIGRRSNEFLYELKSWQIQLIIKGYYRRNREMWSSIRWQTYNLMSVGMADLKKAGIHHPTDLIKFPWDNEKRNLPTKEEVADLQALIAAENARLSKPTQ